MIAGVDHARVARVRQVRKIQSATNFEVQLPEQLQGLDILWQAALQCNLSSAVIMLLVLFVFAFLGEPSRVPGFC